MLTSKDLNDFRLTIKAKYLSLDNERLDNSCQQLLEGAERAAMILKDFTSDQQENRFKVKLLKIKSQEDLLQSAATFDKLKNNVEFTQQKLIIVLKKRANLLAKLDYIIYLNSKNVSHFCDETCKFSGKDSRALLKLLRLIYSDVRGEESDMRKCEPLMNFENKIARLMEFNV